MSERDKQVKHHLREALRLMENVEEVTKKKTPKIPPKKDKPLTGTDRDYNTNPQNTLSGISWSYQGNMVLFSVPYKYKEGFKRIVIQECAELAEWDKGLKLWKIHEDQVTNSLLDELTNTPPEHLGEEHKP